VVVGAVGMRLISLPAKAPEVLEGLVEVVTVEQEMNLIVH